MALFARGVIRAIGRSMMPEFIRIGVSRRGVQRWLQEQYGQAYRWDTLRNDYNEFLGVFTHQAEIERLTSIDRPAVRNMVETDLTSAANYRIMGKATVQDRTSGEVYEKWVGMYTDEAYSEEEYYDLLENEYDKYEQYSNVDIVSVDVKAYFHNRGLGY